MPLSRLLLPAIILPILAAPALPAEEARVSIPNFRAADGWLELDLEVRGGFTEKTVEDLRRAQETLSDLGVRGLIMDLRSNPGGLLRSAVDMADLFLGGRDGTVDRCSCGERSPSAARSPFA